MDYNWITHRLATGAGLSGVEDAAALVADGVTHVIDCRAEFDDAPLFVAHPEISYLWNPTNDDGQLKPNDWFDRSITFALDALTHHHAKVDAHCAAGVNRGPSTAYAILLALGWEDEAAEAAIRAVRPQVGLAYKADAIRAVGELGWR